MKYQQEKSAFRLSAQNYQAQYNRVQKLITISSAQGEPYYGLSIFSAANRLRSSDPLQVCRDLSSGEPQLELAEVKGGMVLKIETLSSLWKRKLVVFEFAETYFTVKLELEGDGLLDRVYFFRGNHAGSQLASLPWFRDYVYAQPNFLEKKIYHSSEYTTISTGANSLDWGPCLNSAPFIYGFGTEKQAGMLFAGLLARQGTNTFSEWEYNYQDQEIHATHDSVVGTQAFSLAYYGQQTISGSWTSPQIMFFFEESEDTGFRRYIRHLYDENFVGTCRIPDRSWRRPIFCGWHEQVATAMEKPLAAGMHQDKAFLEGAKESFSLCTQARHEHWLSLFEEYDIPIGTLIIDATWQGANGLNMVDTGKFPDLRGFIDRCHEQNIKVLLWLNAWDRSGLADEFCLQKNGEPVAPDPTLPAYADLLRQQVHRMAASDSGCYNCDGFKLDGTGTIPYGYGVKTHGNIYGFELQRTYIELLYHALHQANPQAALSLCIANPYFADICDMVRTGDLYTTLASCRSTNRRRFEIFQMAMPGKPMDTDGTFRFSYSDEHEQLLHEQCRLGIPTLYQIENILHCRAFMPSYYTQLEPDDYQKISEILHTYLQTNHL